MEKEGVRVLVNGLSLYQLAVTQAQCLLRVSSWRARLPLPSCAPALCAPESRTKMPSAQGFWGTKPGQHFHVQPGCT